MNRVSATWAESWFGERIYRERHRGVAERAAGGARRLGGYGQGVGTPAQQVHDGETISVEAAGNLGVRFLGVDAPEVSFQLPEGTTVIPISDSRWDAFLDDPFVSDLPPFDVPLSRGLRAHLGNRLGPDCAANHAQHAEVAQRALEEEIRRDMEASGRQGAVRVLPGLCGRGDGSLRTPSRIQPSGPSGRFRRPRRASAREPRGT